MTDKSQVYSWDDEVEESSFKVLPDGDYAFTVTKFERGWYEARAGARIPSCNQALIEFTIKWVNDNGVEQESKLTYSLKLARLLQFTVYQFFESIGLRKKGDGTTKMPWDSMVGKSGVCQIGQHEDSKGNVYNDIVKCYPAEDAPTVTRNERESASGGYSL